MSEAVVHLPRLHAGQLTVREGRARFTVLQCGRRFGKTKYGEDEAIDPALHGYPVGWFAPTYKIMQGAWDELVDVLRDVIVTANKTDAKIILIGGGSIEFWSLHNNEDAGRSRKYKRIIVDEAGLIRNLRKIWHASLRATLADYKGDALFLGTPKGHNDFHRLYLQGQGGDPEWASFRMGTITNPFIAPSEIEAARRQLPADVFDQEYLGIPAEDGGNPFGLSHIAACVRDQSDKPSVAFGVDLAKSVDWTVVLGLDEDSNTCEFHRWQRVPWNETTARVMDIVGTTPTLADSTGVGDPIVEEMARKHPNIEGFKFTSESKQRLMEGLAAAIQGHTTGILDGVCRAEHESFMYEMRPGGGVRYSAPEGMHDDCVCAQALAVEMKRRHVSGSVAVYHHGKSQDPGAGQQDGEPMRVYADRMRRCDPNWGFETRTRRRR